MKTTDSIDAQVLGWSGLGIATFVAAVLIAGCAPARAESRPALDCSHGAAAEYAGDER